MDTLGYLYAFQLFSILRFFPQRALDALGLEPSDDDVAMLCEEMGHFGTPEELDEDGVTVSFAEFAACMSQHREET